jgi:hypothetical protein
VSGDSRLLDPMPALDHADRMLRGIGAGTAGLWPRTAARLTRLAIERATDLYWSRTRPEMAACPTTIRILMLEQALGRSGARQAFLLWSRLSDATHVHPYELAPTVSELRNWHKESTHLVIQLAAAGATPTSGTSSGTTEQGSPPG